MLTQCMKIFMHRQGQEAGIATFDPSHSKLQQLSSSSPSQMHFRVQQLGSSPFMSV